MTTMSRTRPRTEGELTRMQLDAVDAWHRARHEAEQSGAAGPASREARMDVARRLEVLRAQHRAIIERSEQHMEASVHLLARRMQPRAVVVHRNEWFTRKVCEGLAALGVEVVGELENGAHGVGVVVAEQPDLLVVEDTLPMVPGEDVIRQARQFSPSTIVVAQVAYEDRIPALLEAGARAAYTRRVPPDDVVSGVLELLHERV